MRGGRLKRYFSGQVVSELRGSDQTGHYQPYCLFQFWILATFLEPFLHACLSEPENIRTLLGQARCLSSLAFCSFIGQADAYGKSTRWLSRIWMHHSTVRALNPHVIPNLCPAQSSLNVLDV